MTESPSLEPLAMLALDAGRMLMETGASASSVEDLVRKVAHGLGAETVDLRIGYASLAMTVFQGHHGITRMRRVGHLGVNMRLAQEIWLLADRVSERSLSVQQARAELDRIATGTPRYSPWTTAVAVGLACASFGRLLDVDWPAVGPIFLASTAGQYLRHTLLKHRINVYLCVALTALVSSLIGSFGAHWSGSKTITTAMLASVLLLVPGIPAVNAQSDILDGHPTLGSARAVTVIMTLIFMAAGLWIGPMLLGVWH